MKPLDNVCEWEKRICTFNFEEIMFADEKKQWDELTEPEKKGALKALLEKPILFEGPEIIYNWYLRSKWGDALKLIHKSDSISVLEIGAGACDTMPRVVSKKYNVSESEYVTANLNKILTAGLKAKTRNLPVKVRIIEDAAQKIKNYIGKTPFDVIAFEHSANDVIETIFAEKNGIDTINTDWMDILPDITEIVTCEYRNNTFEKSVKKEFLELIKSCLNVLKPGGWIVINHYQFQYNLDIGLDPDLNENLINIIRNWISDAKLGQEFYFDGFEPRWWIFIKNI